MKSKEWRSVLAGRYEASDAGRIRRAKGGRILGLNKNSDGYLCIGACLGPGTTPSTVCVHRLVAEAFIGPRPPGMEVNHKDGDKQNNRSTNLEYVTHAENLRHAYRIGLQLPQFGLANGAAKLNPVDVADMRLQYRSGKVSQSDLAKKYGVCQSHVSRIIKGKLWVDRDDPMAQRRRLREEAESRE